MAPRYIPWPNSGLQRSLYNITTPPYHLALHCLISARANKNDQTEKTAPGKKKEEKNPHFREQRRMVFHAMLPVAHDAECKSCLHPIYPPIVFRFVFSHRPSEPSLTQAQSHSSARIDRHRQQPYGPNANATTGLASSQNTLIVRNRCSRQRPYRKPLASQILTSSHVDQQFCVLPFDDVCLNSARVMERLQDPRIEAETNNSTVDASLWQAMIAYLSVAWFTGCWIRDVLKGQSYSMTAYIHTHIHTYYY